MVSGGGGAGRVTVRAPRSVGEEETALGHTGLKQFYNWARVNTGSA